MSLFSVKPEFIVGGAQKGGTTSLFRYLVQHPGVISPVTKEIGYFSDHYAQGKEWYAANYPSITKRARFSWRRRAWLRTGEATPYYLFHPHAPARIKRDLPDVRLIFLLRNPAERAFSHFRHHVKLGEETLDFEGAIAAEEERLAGEIERMCDDESYAGDNYRLFSYLRRGCYAEQLERWFALFSREQILILGSEDFFSDPEAGYLASQDFIGLTPHKRDEYETFNPGSKPAISEPAVALMQAYFRPHNERLFDLLGTDFGWNDG